MQSILDEKAKLIDVIENALKLAKQKGADSAEVEASVNDGYTVNVRMGEVDTLEYERDKGIGISVYFGNQKGSASSSDTSVEAIANAVAAACDIAKYTTKDSCNGLADKALMAYDYPDLDLYHPWDLNPEAAIDLAKQCEAKALAYDKRIINSEGSSISSHQGLYAYGNSHDFLGVFPSTRHNMSCVLVGKEGDSMERDYEYTVARDASSLMGKEQLAESAAKKTVARLNAKQIPTTKTKVLFRADVAKSLWGHFIAAISGGCLYRKASFLLDSLHQQIFPDFINISERPHLKCALGSAPFDHEGVKIHEHPIISQGELQSYVLSSYSARKLGMNTTGNAGGVHNLVIESGGDSFSDVLKQLGEGLFVTELIGHGVNTITGDYSRGAAGFWVEQGEIKFPVSEITIAGNLKEMFSNIETVANDVDIRGNVRTGSVLLKEMTIAGS